MREIKFRGYAKEELINSQWITNGYGVAKIEYANGENELCLITQYGNYITVVGNVFENKDLLD